MRGTVSQVISPKDAMFNAVPNLESYLKAGRSVADVVRMATALAQMEPASILDYGCGHGRILRWYRHYFPTVALTAADVTADQIEFCAETFAAIPFLLDKHFSAIALPSSYDLIWLGSIYTHIDRESWQDLTDMLEEHLNPGGLLCFSFAGSTVMRLLETGDRWRIAQAAEPAVMKLLAAYKKSGFGFLQQHDSNGAAWGRSIAKYDWVLNFLSRRSAKIILFSEAAYAKRQDVVCAQFPFQRGASDRFE